MFCAIFCAVWIMPHTLTAATGIAPYVTENLKKQGEKSQPALNSDAALSKTSDLTVVLGLKDAVNLALRNNLKTALSEESIGEAKGRRLVNLSELLPHLSGSVSETRVGRLNLASMGFKSQGLIGPFNTFDARLQLVQRIFDLSAISKFQAGLSDVKIETLNDFLARQQITVAAVIAYLNVLDSEGKRIAAEADLKLSKHLFSLAGQQYKAEVANQVDVARAETHWAEEKVVFSQVDLSVQEAYLNLKRITGIPFDKEIVLSDSLDFIKHAAPSMQEAVISSEAKRMEMKIANEQVKQSNYQLRAAKTQWVPKLEAAGDYGLNGDTPNGSVRQTGEASVRLTMPFFEGGALKGQLDQAQSQKRQLELKRDDLKKQIDQDVLLALATITVATDQVQAAKDVVRLATKELTMADDRFAAGVGDNIEVLSAQTTLARARNTYVSALTQYHSARINLSYALGEPEIFFLKSKSKEDE